MYHGLIVFIQQNIRSFDVPMNDSWVYIIHYMPHKLIALSYTLEKKKKKKKKIKIE